MKLPTGNPVLKVPWSHLTAGLLTGTCAPTFFSPRFYYLTDSSSPTHSHWDFGFITHYCEEQLSSRCSAGDCICVLSHSVVSNSLRPHELQPARFLCPWNFPGKNIKGGCHSLLQGIFLIQGSNLGLLCCRQILYHLSLIDLSKIILLGGKKWGFYSSYCTCQTLFE